jgi:hypothetical protein
MELTTISSNTSPTSTNVYTEWSGESVVLLWPDVFNAEGHTHRRSNFRPITYISDFYELITKCVTEVMQLEVEYKGLISETNWERQGGYRGGSSQQGTSYTRCGST